MRQVILIIKIISIKNLTCDRHCRFASLSPDIKYQINFIVSDSENVDGIPVIFGKTKILAIKEDEVILSDVGVYSDVKKRLRRKSHLVKYDFNTLYDLESDVNISFDINNISGTIGEWEEDIRN